MNFLPIRQIADSFHQTLEQSDRLVVAASPGAGKSTVVPHWAAQALAGRIIVLEPRRIAARMAAARINELTGQSDYAGFMVRGEERVTKQTRIVFITEGILTHIMQDDPELTGVTAVIFDEFHERSLNCDLNIALALDIQKNLRPDLKIIVMSATMDLARVSAFLGDCPVLESPGKLFPLTVRHEEEQVALSDLYKICLRRISQALRESTGDLLVFLPGLREIDDLAKLLTYDNVEILKLHGNLSAAEQQRAVSRRDQRKIILSTNVAESSITIDGVTAVVDSGLERKLEFDPGCGMPQLKLGPISQASAAQRAGRAGRTAPGTVYRLWTIFEHQQRPAAIAPEILSADLTNFRLEVARWGASCTDLCFPDPPPPGNLAAAEQSLIELDAFDRDLHLTAIGRKLAKLPVHPKIGAMLLKAAELNLTSLGCEIAGILEERDRFQDFSSADLDLRIMEMRQKPGKFQQQIIIRDQLLRMMGCRYQACDFTYAGLLTAFAWPEWIGRQRAFHSRDYQLVSGRGAVLPPDDDLGAHEFLSVCRLSGDVKAQIRLAARFDEAWITQHFLYLLKETREVVFDESKKAVEARRLTMLGNLVLKSAPYRPEPGEITDALFAAAAKTAQALLPEIPFWERLSFAARNEPETYPLWDRQMLLDFARNYLPAAKSFADIANLDWRTVLANELGSGRLQQLDRDYPEKYRNFKIDYSGETPQISLRVQELYGVNVHPTVGRKRIALKLELLSPARRPVQITSDLPRFWAENWKYVQKEMKSRYPKHDWPDRPGDPV